MAKQQHNNPLSKSPTVLWKKVFLICVIVVLILMIAYFINFAFLHITVGAMAVYLLQTFVVPVVKDKLSKLVDQGWKKISESRASKDLVDLIVILDETSSDARIDLYERRYHKPLPSKELKQSKGVVKLIQRKQEVYKAHFPGVRSGTITLYNSKSQKIKHETIPPGKKTYKVTWVHESDKA